MHRSPWQRAVVAIRQALDLADETALAAAREIALALAVPHELKELVASSDARALREWLPDWASDGFGERALARPVEVLQGIGPKRGEQLRARGRGRVGDLLFHLPMDYDDRRSLEVIGELDDQRPRLMSLEVDHKHTVGELLERASARMSVEVK